MDQEDAFQFVKRKGREKRNSVGSSFPVEIVIVVVVMVDVLVVIIW